MRLSEESIMRSLLATLCPPAAVLASGRTSQAAINLGLTLCFFVPGVLHALSVVGGYKLQRRNEMLMRLAEKYYS
jgi:uncharacterized membrane protein YqaE (UPF0057 family)